MGSELQDLTRAYHRRRYRLVGMQANIRNLAIQFPAMRRDVDQIVEAIDRQLKAMREGYFRQKELIEK